MTREKLIKTTGTLIGAVLFSACTQMAGNHKRTPGMKAMVIANSNCQQMIAADKSAYGMIGLQIKHDYVKSNKILVIGKAVISTGPLNVNPYIALGETPKSTADSKAISDVKLGGVGSSITVALGANPEVPEDSSDLKESDHQSVIRASTARGAKNVIRDPRFPDASSVITLRKTAYNSKVYVTPEDEQTVASGVAPILATGQSASVPQPGFMKLRSVTIAVPKIANPIIKNIPGDPRVLDIDEYAQGYEPNSAGSFTIKLAKDSNFPSTAADADQIERNIMVQIEKFGSAPSPFAANCVIKDEGQESIELPLKAKTLGAGAKDEDLTGDLRLSVYRSYVRKVPMGDKEKPGAFIYVETRSGFTTFATGLPEKK